MGNREDNENYGINEADKGRSREEKDELSSEERTEYYYSYGPFKARQGDHSNLPEPTSSLSHSGETSSVVVSPPGPIRTSGSGGADRPGSQQLGANTWAYQGGKKRTSFKTIFASFMIGALALFVMAAAVDQMNLFTNLGMLNQIQQPAANSPVVTTMDGSEDGSIRNAALEIVRPNTIADIVSKASPAVVKIETLVSQNGGSSANPMLDDDFYRFFFDDHSEQSPNDEKRPSGMGSGFIFDDSGYILTNEHVVTGSDEIYVTIEGYQERFKAKLLGSSFELDLAVIKIESDKALPILKLGDSQNVRVGDWLTAIGNPIGFDHSVSVGVLSAKERNINIPDKQGVRRYEHLLQTDASINPGNSGGPLINLDGEVIGINTAVSLQAQGIGFAIPTSTISEVLERLKNNEEIPKPPAPFIGVELRNIEKNWMEELQIKSTEGTLVSNVVFNSPAHKAGLNVYDVIIALNGTSIKNAADLGEQVKKQKVGDEISLTVMRNGKEIEIKVTVGNQNDMKVN